MSTDWKDALAALRGEVAPAHEGDSLEEAIQSNDDTATAQTAKKEKLHIAMERKGRHGKTATIIDGFCCSEKELADVARKLKQAIGTGGAARGGEILLQGDWRSRAAELLRSYGYKI